MPTSDKNQHYYSTSKAPIPHINTGTATLVTTERYTRAAWPSN